MDNLVYVLWVSIPVVLFVLGIFAKLTQYLFPREDDDPKKARRIFRLANIFAIYAVICIAVDQYLIDRLFGDDHLFPALALQTRTTIRLAILPILAFVGFLFLTIRRLLRPPPTFDRLRMETRGSHPGFWILIMVVFALIAFKREKGEKFSFTLPSSFIQGFRVTQDKTNKTGTPTPQLQSEQKGLASELVDKMKSLAGMANLPTPSSEPTTEDDNRPDYNPEGVYRFGPMVRATADKQKVDAALVQALIETSSGFNERWVGRDGRSGLLPLSSAIAKRYNVRNSLNATSNIEGGCRYIKDLMTKFKGDVTLVIAAFHAGEETVSSGADLVNNAELKEFVKRTKTVYEITKERDFRP